MDKILKVCLSSEFPDILERKENYIYFLYDKLELYFGQNRLSEDFAITNKIPELPVPGMIYILNTDGSVHRQVDYSDITIATIESKDQIELLQKAGTIFYINNNKRYMDSQRRTLTLPFNNGNYELSVAMKNEQIFDNNTILKYNEKNERFEVYGDLDEEFIDFSKPFRGGETNSVKIKADGPSLRANVKISSLMNNMLRAASDGLYVFTKDKVDREEYEEWANKINEFEQYSKDVIDRIESDLAHLEEVASEEAIHNEIMNILIAKYPTIEEALEKYQEIANSLSSIETEVLNYSTTEIMNTKNEINSGIKKSCEWEDLNDISDYSQSIDYYQKTKEYLNPEELADEDVQVILAAVVNYIEETGGNIMKTYGIGLNGKEYIVSVREIDSSNDSIIDADITDSTNKNESDSNSSTVDTESKNEEIPDTTDIIENENKDSKSEEVEESTDKITDDTNDAESIIEEVNPSSEESDSNNDELEKN